MKIIPTTSQGEATRAIIDATEQRQEAVERFRRRMLEWENPVEYVNNMYGSHPDDDDNEYFEVVFARR